MGAPVPHNHTFPFPDFKECYEKYSHWFVDRLGVDEPVPQNIFLKETKGACVRYINLLQHASCSHDITRYCFTKNILNPKNVAEKADSPPLQPLLPFLAVEVLIPCSRHHHPIKRKEATIQRDRQQKQADKFLKVCLDHCVGRCKVQLPAIPVPLTAWLSCVVLHLSTSYDKQILHLLHIYLPHINEY